MEKVDFSYSIADLEDIVKREDEESSSFSDNQPLVFPQISSVSALNLSFDPPQSAVPIFPA